MDTTTQEVPGSDTAKLKAEVRQLRDDIRELAGSLRSVTPARPNRAKPSPGNA